MAKPTLSGAARTARQVTLSLVHLGHDFDNLRQRESSATIQAAPTAYELTEPAKPQPILVFDCRGLEFTEFIPEVLKFQIPVQREKTDDTTGRVAC